jgi:hypothetical protein
MFGISGIGTIIANKWAEIEVLGNSLQKKLAPFPLRVSASKRVGQYK